MGSSESTLKQHGYTVARELEKAVLVNSKDGDQCVIKRINLRGATSRSLTDICEAVKILQGLSHPHIVKHQKDFKDAEYMYIVSEYCSGGNLYQKIKEQSEKGEPFSEEQILDWILNICMALKYLHGLNVKHEDLQPKNIFFTEYRMIRLGELGEFNERLVAGVAGPTKDGALQYIPPEILDGKTYDEKSDIWALGCVLYELCMLKCAFSADSTVKLIPKILNGSYPPLPHNISHNLQQLIEETLQPDPAKRPHAREIIWKPFVLSFLTARSEKTIEGLNENLEQLRKLAHGLESVHYGATVGSLTGGVIGAAGGITSIVGLILAPFTLGASLIVTGVGVGVAVAGGTTAGISNITNMVNQSTDRKNIRNIILEFQEKMNSVVICLQYITEGLEELRQQISLEYEQQSSAGEDFARVGARVSRGLGAVPELVRLLQVANMGKVAAQAARAVRVAEVATGVFSAFFVALDVFFIAMDAKEIHHIRTMKATLADDMKSKLTLQSPEATDSNSGADQEPKSETMKFVKKIRETADELQNSLDELKEIISFIPKLYMMASGNVFLVSKLQWVQCWSVQGSEVGEDQHLQGLHHM
ncbi:calcium/calmodulin-dependent protein kinase type II subunit beta-like [Chanos chanos]|uniref:non-specific serine/threonine protein kinase n=1 Tax=Chanos chanos TaxID=29144 RepID=A0A6J2VTL8_CHACN|nr:calcium/calmodulin-dependent protein kinase type II subunit beta-like [Chanos chanos]